ncbi:MAG: M10 family metallopeptidase domain-containing protein [Oligoflexia bacterium]|nr:M10 family metallopeptidase domain-containing protein [Oligoflexia bacterium]
MILLLFTVTGGCGATDSEPALGDRAPAGFDSGMNPVRGAADTDPDPPVTGESCRNGDPERVCLALRYVVYRDAAGVPLVSREEAIRNVRQINSVWARCNLGFQIEEYLPVNPESSGLRFRTADYPELDEIREAFGNGQTLLVTTTGSWDRTGGLGDTGANAWTSMPGSGPYGAILERSVGTYANIIAHELGHYLNLLHVNDPADLMNPIIYASSTALYANQCASARKAARTFWQRMLR